ncbi:ferritin-like protein [Pseudonocardia lacus]|uniref:ferritin-like protein n=1 Tax=Pseudonocardia lacus TaxID=2835865 RepID=UPI001BDD26AC|nr:ferritin-like protein [Pseudonocardia lacus]
MEPRLFAQRAFPPVQPQKAAASARRASRAAVASGSLHDPALEPRDEVVFLLTAAAEIEHALMVQYLYAAYSVRVSGPHSDELARVRDLLVQIAREEMGHLVTVQNLLHLVGGPLNLGRDRAPYGSGIYPFRFTLEPLTLASLAKYVTAESPAELPEDMDPQDVDLVEAIRLDAVAANGGEEVRHVGPVFDRLTELLEDPAAVADADLRTDTARLQADPTDWGYAPLRGVDGSPLVVGSFPGTDPAALRAGALAAVHAIAEQGEGFDLPPADARSDESHFERFLDLYRRVAALRQLGDPVSWPVAVNPTTSTTADPAVRITEARARGWAQLFDLRYRMLLGQLQHFLRLDQEVYREDEGPRQGDRTARGLLLLGAFDEMRHLGKIAGKLVQMPMHPGAVVHAGPPFELPYTLALPDDERSRWRAHLDASRAAVRVATAVRRLAEDPFLAALVAVDVEAQTALAALAAGDDVPEESLPTGFAKAVAILEEAVHGFRVRARHGSFWAGRTRDEFVATLVPPVDLTPVALDQTGAVVPDPAEAQLLQRLDAAPPRDRMPRLRPAVPPARRAYLAGWIGAGAPDDDPPGRVGVRVEPDPQDEPTAPVVGPPGFAVDIASLFRPSDRAAMAFVFDLGRFEDVRDNADAILTRLEDGSMPCDAPWQAERIALFRRWVDGGRLP